jgi:predicted RND superfamily exporter protein
VRDRIELALAAWGGFVYRHAWTTIAIMVAITGAIGTQLPKIEIDTSTEGFLHEDDPARLGYDAFRRQFGRDDLILLVIEAPAIFDATFLERLRAVHDELESEVPLLEEVTSLINARHTRGEADRLVVGDLLEDWPESPEELAALREIALANPLYLDHLLSEDGRLTTVTIETAAYVETGVDEALLGFDDAEPSNGGQTRLLTGEDNALIVEAVLAVVARHDRPDFRIHVSGTPPMVHLVQTTMLKDMRRFLLISLAAIAGFLLLLFRRAAGVVLPLLVVLLSIVCTISWMAAAGIAITMPSQILPSFLLAVGIGASVHVLVIFFQRFELDEPREQAISSALGHSGLAIVMTSLTTAGGLLSFVAAEVAPIAEFGLAAPIGVLNSLLFTLVLLPALLAVFPMRRVGRRERPRNERLRLLLVSIGDASTRRAPFVVVTAAGILVIAALGALQLRFSHYPLAWFPEEDPFRQATLLVNDRMKGSVFLEVIVDSGRENGLQDPAMLERIEEMRRWASSYQYQDVFVGKTIALPDVVKEIHQALNENRSDFHMIPRERAQVAQELLLFENTGSDDLEQLVDSQFRRGRFTMKLPFVDAMQYEHYLRVVDANLARILGGAASFELTGLLAIMGGTFTAVMRSMARTYVLALLVITPLMVLLIGNLRIGMLSMVPNLAPILVTLGVMGWSGIPLDAFTLLIGSIAIGLAVDDTIHFLHGFRRYYSRSGDARQAVRETLSTTGQALLFTSLVLATGFLVYTLATMQILFYFGALTGLTITLAFLADLILTPALVTLALRGERATAAPDSNPVDFGIVQGGNAIH